VTKSRFSGRLAKERTANFRFFRFSRCEIELIFVHENFAVAQELASALDGPKRNCNETAQISNALQATSSNPVCALFFSFLVFFSSLVSFSALHRLFLPNLHTTVKTCVDSSHAVKRLKLVLRASIIVRGVKD